MICQPKRHFFQVNGFSNFETYCKEHVVERDRWIQKYYEILDICQVKERNGYVLGEDSYVMRVRGDRNDMLNDLDTYAGKRVGYMEDIKETVDAYGGQVIYLNLPHKVELYTDKFPPFYYSCEEIWDKYRENVIAEATAKGITCVETYDLLREHKDEYIYYVTDHHYTVRGAYYVYSALLEEINKTWEEPLCFPKWDDLEITTSSSRMVGSYLLKLGDSGKISVDYMEYAIPKDMPSFERWDNGNASKKKLFSKDINSYSSFMGGNIGNTVVKTYRDELPSILYIGYSYANLLEMYSVYNFNEMHSIDPRYWDGNICDYIESTQVDYVVIVRDDLSEGNKENICTVR